MKLILNGQHEIAALDPARPAPPLYMPAWGSTIKEGEIDDLVAYLQTRGRAKDWRPDNDYEK